MKIQDIMSTGVTYLPANSSVQKAAETMQKLNCGFLPVGDAQEEKLQGVITDRDIVVRAIAKGHDPGKTPVEDIISRNVLYCFAGDDIRSACESMQQQHVYRLIVLNNPKEKKLAGIISLGDIVRHGDIHLAEQAAKGILKAA